MMLPIWMGCRALDPGVAPTAVLNENTTVGAKTVALDSAGTHLAVGDWEGWVRIWRLPHQETVQVWQAHHDPITGLAFLGRGAVMVTAALDGSLRTWNGAGQLLNSQGSPSPITQLLAVEAKAIEIVTAHRDGTVRIWDGETLGQRHVRRLHEGVVLAVAWDAVGQHVASSGRDGRVVLWQLSKEPEELKMPPTDAHSLAFAAGGDHLYAGGWFRLFRWDLNGGELSVLPTPHHGLITRLAVHPKEGYLATISRETDSAVYLLDPTEGHGLLRVGRQPLCGTDVQWSSDGRYLASTGDDGSVRVWSLAELKSQAGVAK